MRASGLGFGGWGHVVLKGLSRDNTPCGGYVGLHRDGHKGFRVRLSGPGVLKRFCRDINGGIHDSCDVRGIYKP